ncbi:MAG: acyl carrier protein [Patescibacteria group bacterium]
MLEKITEILRSKHFNIEEQITEVSEIKKFSGWDSLKHLSLLLRAEEDFEIEISPEEASEIITIGDLIEKIKQK